MATVFALTILATASITSFAATKTRLETPTDVFWSDKSGEEDDGSYANWSEVEHAKSYEVYLYCQKEDSSSYTKVGEFTTSKTKLNLRGKMTYDADYAFRVRAVGKGSYSTSNWSEYSEFNYFDKVGSSAEDNTTPSSGPSGTGYTPVTNNGVVSGYGWQLTNNRWWYSTSPIGSSWYTSGWYWIDGNKDGISECYCFDADGYMYQNCATPDGYTVNNDGAWTVNGVVQRK